MQPYLKDLFKILGICVILSIILTVFVFSNPQKFNKNRYAKENLKGFNKNSTVNERFNEYKLSSVSNKLLDGYYIITNRNNNTEHCLLSNDDSVYLSNQNDRLCGYNSLDNLIKDGKAVWYIKNIKDDIFLIASGYDDLNKCLIFGNNGKNNYLSKFSWGYSNDNMCGVSDGVGSFNNSIGRSLFKINGIGNNKFTIINTSNMNTNNTESIWPNTTSPSDTTSSTLLSDDINSMSSYYMSRNKTLAIPYCVGVDPTDNKPIRLVSYDNPDNKNACGFNSFNELINDGRMVWFFYKLNK